MLTFSSVSVHFGGLRVLEEVRLTVPEGRIFGLIGPNGAGKTTLFNLATGLLAPSAGAIEFSGARLNGLPPHRITRLGIARTFQNIRLFKEMTLTENVLVALAGRGSSSGGGRQDRVVAHELLERMGLGGKPDRVAGTLSYGEQRRLEIARALATQPKLLLLDEPAAGMNGAEKQQVIDEIAGLNANGLTILLIDHDMSVIMGLCHEIAVLHFGKVIARGAPEKIRLDPAVIEAYLGQDDQVDSAEKSLQ
jgi:branched-chain amino acid transport system ATP-binding protein